MIADDELTAIWLAAAQHMKLHVERSAAAYAASDGHRRLLIGTDETLDADDSVAQLIFHEICHWIVQGEVAIELPDWGLDNTHSTAGIVPELVCLRLQAWLAGRYRLRALMRPTTPYAAYYDRLPVDLRGLKKEEARALCPTERQVQKRFWPATQRSAGPPWQPHLARALVATQRLAGKRRADVCRKT